ncbi:multidrug efflux SMR transporter [Acetobacteraceae bacterium]|nr:multidrug efflux SMR transporter [Acetobacteraceae bacterium]
MAWVYLLLAGMTELGFTTSMRFIHGLRDIGWIFSVFVFSVISLTLIHMAAKTIPMGTAYAVWVAIGAVGTVIIGMAFFNEPVSVFRFVCIAGIILCVAGLELTGN